MFSRLPRLGLDQAHRPLITPSRFAVQSSVARQPACLQQHLLVRCSSPPRLFPDSFHPLTPDSTFFPPPHLVQPAARQRSRAIWSPSPSPDRAYRSLAESALITAHTASRSTERLKSHLTARPTQTEATSPDVSTARAASSAQVSQAHAAAQASRPCRADLRHVGSGERSAYAGFHQP